MSTCLCYANTAHIKKKYEIAPLRKQVILVCMHTAVVKVPEVLEKAKKGYHFKAKLLPK